MATLYFYLDGCGNLKLPEYCKKKMKNVSKLIIQDLIMKQGIRFSTINSWKMCNIFHL